MCCLQYSNNTLGSIIGDVASKVCTLEQLSDMRELSASCEVDAWLRDILLIKVPMTELEGGCLDWPTLFVTDIQS
jgi:hypothetical protein